MSEHPPHETPNPKISRRAIGSDRSDHMIDRSIATVDRDGRSIDHDPIRSTPTKGARVTRMRARARERDETYRGGVDGESHGGAHRRASLEALRRASAELHLESRHARRIGSVHAQVAHSRIHSRRSFAREVFATDDGTRARRRRRRVRRRRRASHARECDIKTRRITRRRRNRAHRIATARRALARDRDRSPRPRPRERSNASTHFRASHRARDRRTRARARANNHTRTNAHLGGRLGGHGRGEDRGHGE